MKTITLLLVGVAIGTWFAHFVLVYLRYRRHAQRNVWNENRRKMVDELLKAEADSHNVVNLGGQHNVAYSKLQDAPFEPGDIVECDVEIPGYHQHKGELYTVTQCFCTEGPRGWNWWICVAETPVSKLASDFHLAEIPIIDPPKISLNE